MLTNEQLSRIKIKGYKSIKECNLHLDNINVLIGSNGAGKSNFISVFSLIQNILNHNLQLSVGIAGLNSLLYKGRKITDKISIEAYFGNNSYGFDLIATDNNSLIFSDEYFGYNFSYDVKLSLGSGHSESKWEDGIDNRINDYVYPILKKQAWKVYHFHDTSRSSKIKQEHSIANAAALAEDAGNLAAFLFRLKYNHPKNYKEIVQTVRLIAPYFSDFVLEPQEHNREQILLKWKQIGCDDVFYSSQLSDGTLRFICLATLLLQPESLQPPTIIIDEPELGLHPIAITMVAEMVKQIGAKKQIILSTQSVELLNEFEPENVIVVNSTKMGTSFRRVNAEELVSWLENDYSLGELWKKNLLGGRLA